MAVYFNGNKVNIATGLIAAGNDKALIEKTITGTYAIPDGTTKVGAYGLAGQTGVTNLNIPTSVTNLSDYALYNMTGLKNLTLPNSVTSIGEYSCANLTGLEEFVYDANIPVDAYSDKERNMFYNTTGKFVVGKNTARIPDYLFGTSSSNYQTKFTRFIAERNKSLTIGKNLFGPVTHSYLKVIWLDCGDNTMTFRQKCFANINGTVRVFLNATNITGGSSSTDFFSSSGYSTGIVVKFGENTKTIGSYLFYNNTYLRNVYIPSSVTTISANAFQSRKNANVLKGITIDKAEPPTLSNTNAFTNTNNCPIYVPAESVGAYQGATNWSTYASRITALSYENYTDGTNTLILGNNLWFDLVVDGVAYTGIYTLTDGALSLILFDKNLTTTYTGTIADGVATITVNGTTYTLSLEA